MKFKKLKCWKDIESDGLAFENIIKKLLKVMFPTETYTHTPKTHDGGKDFICITNGGDKIWAECKNYAASLATSDISKTFVMAIVESVKKVIIFSITPLSPIAIHEINSYISKSIYTIELFDGESLNSIINLYLNDLNLSNKFARSFKLEYNNGKKYEFFSQIIRNNDYEGFANKIFFIGDMATCIYYIKNNSTTAINAAYSLNMNNVSSEFTHINNKTPQNGTVIIGGNQVLSLSFSFRISNYKNRLTLPSMKIVIGEHIHYIKSKNIQCDWIAEVALLGESRKEFQILNDHYIGSDNLSLISVYGHSGVGKTRMLTEIKHAYEDIDNEVFYFSAKNIINNGRYFVKKLFSYATKLPYISEDSLTVTNSDIKYHVLYDSEYNIEDNLDIILQLTYQCLHNRKIVAIVDDMQDSDSTLRAAVTKILDSVDGNIILVTGFNKDYIFEGTKAAQLFGFVNKLADAVNNKKIELIDFSETIAKEYIDNCLDISLLNNARLNQTTKLFIEKCGTNPLILHQSMLYLAQAGILIKTGDSFFVSDIDAFNSTIRQLTQELYETLRKRHELLKKHLSSKEYKYYISFFVILSVYRTMPSAIYTNIFGDADRYYLYKFLNLGLIKLNDNGDITFYHQKLEQFYFKMPIEQSLRRCLLNYISKINSNAYPQLKFILHNKLNLVTQQQFYDAINIMSTIEFENEYRFFEALYYQCNNFSLENLKYLQFINKYYLVMQSHVGIKKKIENQTYDITVILHKCEMYNNYLNDVWKIVLLGVNALIQLHKNNKAKDILVEMESVISIFNADDIDCKNVLSSIYNRFGVIYQTYSSTKLSENYLQKSLQLGIEIHDKYKIIEAYSDLGSLYYDQINGIIKTCQYWENLFDYYLKNKPNRYEYLCPKCYYHIVYVALLKHQYDKVEILLNEYMNLYWDLTEGFYKIKIMLMNVAFEMFRYLEPSKVHVEKIESLLIHIEDECIASGTVREYYKVFYLKGIFEYHYLNKHDKAYEDFQIAYKQIIDFCGGEDYMLRRYIPVLEVLGTYIKELLPVYQNENLYQLNNDFFLKTQNNIEFLANTGNNQYTIALCDRTGRIKLPKL